MTNVIVIFDITHDGLCFCTHPHVENVNLGTFVVKCRKSWFTHVRVNFLVKILLVIISCLSGSHIGMPSQIGSEAKGEECEGGEAGCCQILPISHSFGCFLPKNVLPLFLHIHSFVIWFTYFACEPGQMKRMLKEHQPKTTVCRSLNLLGGQTSPEKILNIQHRVWLCDSWIMWSKQTWCL